MQTGRGLRPVESTPGSWPRLAAAEAWEAAGQPDTESTVASGAEFAPSYGLRCASANGSSKSSYLPRTMSSCCRSSGRTGHPSGRAR